MNKGNKIMLVLCLLAIAAGIVIYFEASAYQKKAKITEGIVDYRLGSNYHIKYTSDDGVEHILSGSQKNNGHSEGDKIKVFYRMDNPEKARITDGKKGGKKVIIIAVVMLLLNLVSIYQGKKRNSLVIKFKTTGRKVSAEIVSIGTDMNTTIRKMHPFLVNCRWIDPITGKEYTHTIKYIWKDPAPLLAKRNTVDVYIDREDPEKYFMDTEFLGDIAR